MQRRIISRSGVTAMDKWTETGPGLGMTRNSVPLASVVAAPNNEVANGRDHLSSVD